MHLERQILRRMIDDGLGPAERDVVDRHLQNCPQCRDSLDDLRLFALLDTVDDPTPDVDPEELIARAVSRRSPGWGRWAAAIVMTLGAAGAVYAAPGSPVRGVLDSLLRGGEATPVVQRRPEPQSVSGVVVPAVERLAIQFGSQSSGAISVRLVDESSVTVEAVNGVATFDSQAERLVVSSPSTPDYRIQIPRSAASVEVFVGDRVVFQLVNGEVSTTAVPDESGQFSIDFGGAR